MFKVIDAERVSASSMQDLIKSDLTPETLDIALYKIALWTVQNRIVSKPLSRRWAPTTSNKATWNDQGQRRALEWTKQKSVCFNMQGLSVFHLFIPRLQRGYRLDSVHNHPSLALLHQQFRDKGRSHGIWRRRLGPVPLTDEFKGWRREIQSRSYMALFKPTIAPNTLQTHTCPPVSLTWWDLLTSFHFSTFWSDLVHSLSLIKSLNLIKLKFLSLL